MSIFTQLKLCVAVAKFQVAKWLILWHILKYLLLPVLCCNARKKDLNNRYVIIFVSIIIQHFPNEGEDLPPLSWETNLSRLMSLIV